MSNSNVIAVETDEDFKSHMSTAGNKCIVIDFHATWCGPCKMIAPKFMQLSLQYPEMLFLKVDVDKCQNTARTYQVSAMPTFILVQGNVVKGKVRGADAKSLEAKIEELSESTSTGTSTKEPSLVPGMVDLEQFIVEKNCLNESEEHPFKWVFEENSDLYLESDCDPELLISLSFNQVIKLHSISCMAPVTGHAPKTFKLFINQPNVMDFDSARDSTPLQEVQLTEEQCSKGEVIPLKFVKLQNVNNVTLFFPDNQGDEETTIIERLILFGKPVNTTNMEDFKRVAGKKGESH